MIIIFDRQMVFKNGIINNVPFLHTIFTHHFLTPFLNTILNDHYISTIHQ